MASTDKKVTVASVWLVWVLAASPVLAQTVLFQDTFDAGTSASAWTVLDTGDATSDFAYDYSIVGIPSAPNSQGGTTVGLRFSVNNTSGALHAISAYPNGQSFSGEYRLKFDMWMNYNGGAGGGVGSTEHSNVGINHTAAAVHWPNNSASDGFSLAVSGEGGAATDYCAFAGATMFDAASGVYIAGSQNNTHSYYQSLFPTPPFETTGAPGKQWVQVEIGQKDETITWYINGTLIASWEDTTYVSGDIMMGYMDHLYASVASPASDTFVIYDNIRVETYPPPDCNGNGTDDAIDISAGTSLDCNWTGIPDECEDIDDCDFDADGQVNLDDYLALFYCLQGPADLPETCVSTCIDSFDSDGDGDIDLLDYAKFQRVLWTSPIPPRPVGAMTGSEFIAEVSSLSLNARELRVMEEVTSGNIPDFLRGFVEINVSATIGGQLHNATYYVMPDYLCIGSDEDFVRMPMTPLIAQPILDELQGLMPTRKMVDDIYSAAAVKLAPSPINPQTTDITLVSTFYTHHLTIETQRAGQPLGLLIGGIKKDVVITPQLLTHPNRVAIYGWHQLSGVPIQPLYLGHVDFYVDYSHGIRYVKNRMLLDGVEVPVADVLADPDLCVLLSDEGVLTSPSY